MGSLVGELEGSRRPHGHLQAQPPWSALSKCSVRDVMRSATARSGILCWCAGLCLVSFQDLQLDGPDQPGWCVGTSCCGASLSQAHRLGACNAMR